MCICVNCIHVNKCTTYNLIAQQHGRVSKIFSKTFTPISTIIIVNIKINNTTIFDWDLQECLSFAEKPGYWIDMKFNTFN